MGRKKPIQHDGQIKLPFSRDEHGGRAFIPESPKTLDEIVGTARPTEAPDNNCPDYQINNKTLRILFAKVSQEGKSYSLSHKDHFNLARDVFYGVYAMESNRHMNFNGNYGVPHNILVNLTLSEKIALYRGAGIRKKQNSQGTEPKEAYEMPNKEKIMESIEEIIEIGKVTEEGKRFNAVNIMQLRENKAKIPPLSQRLMRITNQDAADFYSALRKPAPRIRDPYRSEPSRGERPEAFFYGGIDLYVGKLISTFQELYGIKTIGIGTI